MSKYKLLTLYRLKELFRENPDAMYSPEGNKVIVVSNGLLGGQLLYDHKSKKLYGLTMKEVTGITEENQEWLDGEYALNQIPYNMNYKEAIEYLKSKGKWEEVTKEGK